MDNLICEYFPVKARSEWGFSYTLMKSKARWSEHEKWDSDKYETKEYTIIGMDEQGIYCDSFNSIYSFLSAAEVEKRIRNAKQDHEKALKAEPKREAARTAIKVAAYGGALAAGLLGIESKKKTVDGIASGINEFVGLDYSPDPNFDEQKERKSYVKIAGSDMFARYWRTAYYLHEKMLRPETMVVKKQRVMRGVPEFYKGKLVPYQCITFVTEEWDPVECSGYCIICEYPDVKTADHAWEALNTYGFA